MKQEPNKIIDQLAVSEARSILKALAASDEGLAGRIAEMAMSSLNQVDVEEIAAVLYNELDALEVEEVWDRAGRTRYGYVEPGEAADQMIEEVLEPFLEELGKYQKLSMGAEANRVCMGLLLGLYTFDSESTTEFKNWAGDAPGIFAETVVDAWKEGRPSREAVRAIRLFVEDELFRWSSSLV